VAAEIRKLRLATNMGLSEVVNHLVRRYDLRGNLISGAHLAALAIEHGPEVCSADVDFARFAEVRWVNPGALGTERSANR